MKASHWRTVKELTEALRFSSTDACRHWLRRQGIASVRRGRVILVDAFDVEHALRHGDQAQPYPNGRQGNRFPAEGTR